MPNLSNKRVLITGGAGFLGRHVTIEFKNRGAIVCVPRFEDYDLRERDEIKRMMDDCKPEVLVHLAANVGGIGYNQKNPANLFYDNAIMGIQLIHESHLREIEKITCVGTVCEYPKHTPVPFKEQDLWLGLPEETNLAYGISKKILLIQGQAYRQQYGMNIIHLLPVNLYGIFDNFKIESSHVMPALIRKFVEAKQNNDSMVSIWGTGNASREFLFVEDAAFAIANATQLYDGGDPVNIGSGREITIKELANMIASMIGFKGEIRFDPSRPDGQPRRCLDTTKAEREFSFKASTSLEVGLAKTIAWYLKEQHVTL